MELVLGGVAIVLVVVGLLWWTRRHGNPGARGTDPYGNRDIGASGGVPITRPSGPQSGAGGAG